MTGPPLLEIFRKGPPLFTAVATALDNLLPLDGRADFIAFQLTGVFGTATVEFEGTVNGTDWVAAAGVPLAGGAAVTSTAAAGIWRFDASGLVGIRFRVATPSGPTLLDGWYFARSRSV